MQTVRKYKKPNNQYLTGLVKYSNYRTVADYRKKYILLKTQAKDTQAIYVKVKSAFHPHRGPKFKYSKNW